MMFISVHLITGFMVGIEFDFKDDLMILDLGIVRLIVGKDDDVYP